MLRKYFIAGGALLAAVSFALAQGGAIGGSGFFPNWRIVGQPSYCAVTTNNVCTQTIPAGPSALTGTETIPANTGIGNQSQANVLIGLASLDALPISFTSIINTGTNSISPTNINGGVVMISAGTISQANIWMPANPINGQRYYISANQTITALNIVPNSGQTVSNNPTALTASTTAPMGYSFIYDLVNTAWRRLQ